MDNEKQYQEIMKKLDLLIEATKARADYSKYEADTIEQKQNKEANFN